MYEKPTVKIMLKDEKLKTFSITSKTRQLWTLATFFNMIMKVLVRAFKNGNKCKDIQIKMNVKFSVYGWHAHVLENTKDFTKTL
jgi:hypothetical protein